MMDVITGKTRPDSGRCFFGSTIDLLRLRENEIASVGIGRKFQKPTVFEHLSVFENLELALKADRGVRASLFFRLSGEQLDRIGEMLTLIHLKDDAQRTAGLLSHGQKQWLEIGMLLMQDPKLLLLDEPVAGMTDEETERTAELFLSLEGSHSLVVVEHDMKFIHALTHGNPARRSPCCTKAACSPKARSPRCRPTRRSSRSTLAAEPASDSARRSNQYYGGSHILRGVSLEAAVGEVTVVLGRNGVGKTTLLKSLMGVVPVRSGTSSFDGADITRETPYQRVRRGIGYVPQGREIFGRLTVQENLRDGPGLQDAARRRCRSELFELFPVLKQMLHRRGGDLSGGQQQQLAIARALAAGPQPAHPRRADRGHPAVDHQGHRPRHPDARRHGAAHRRAAAAHGDRAGRAVLRLRRGARRPLPGDGARRDREQGRGADMAADGVRARMSI